MNEPVPPIDIAGVLGTAVLITLLLNPIVSWLVIARYRSAVERSMRRTVGGAVDLRARPQNRVGPSGKGRGMLPRRLPTDGQVAARARSRVLRTVSWYVVAGVAAALTATTVLLAIDGQEFYPLRSATVLVIYAWPILPTVVVVAALDRRRTVFLAAGYFVLLLCLGLLGPGIVGILEIWAVFDLLASLVLLAVAARPLRAVGPFFAPSLLVLGVGLVTWAWLALPLVELGLNDLTAMLLAVGLGVVAAMLAFLNVPLAAWRYRRKAAGDQSILLAVP